MTITEMNALTIPDVARLEEECFAHPWTEASIEEAYNNPASFFLLARDDDKAVIGYISAYMVRDEAFINNVAVTAAHRREGVARALVDTMLKRVQGNGASFLSLEVRMSNQAAISLYQGAGFEIEGIRKKFYRDPDEDAFIMTKTFDRPHPEDPDGGRWKEGIIL